MRRSVMIALSMAAGLSISAIQDLAAAAAISYGALKTEATLKGEVYTDARGMTLYTYDEDLPGVSNCNDDCARHWPPAIADAHAAATGELSLVRRDDGTLQWAAKGMPLYRFANDPKPGDVTGDKKNEVWHVAHPE